MIILLELTTDYTDKHGCTGMFNHKKHTILKTRLDNFYNSSFKVSANGASIHVLLCSIKIKITITIKIGASGAY